MKAVSVAETEVVVVLVVEVVLLVLCASTLEHIPTNINAAIDGDK